MKTELPDNEIVTSLKEAIANCDKNVARINGLCLSDAEYLAAAMKICQLQKLNAKTHASLLEALKEANLLFDGKQQRAFCMAVAKIVSTVVREEVDEDTANRIMDEVARRLSVGLTGKEPSHGSDQSPITLEEERARDKLLEQ